MRTHFKILELIPENSYLSAFTVMQERLSFGNDAVAFVVTKRGAIGDYTSPEVQREFNAIKHNLEASPWIQGKVLSWYDNFVSYYTLLDQGRHRKYNEAGKVIPPDEYMRWLRMFLHAQGEAHSLNIKCDAAGDKCVGACGKPGDAVTPAVACTRMIYTHTPLRTNDDWLDAMHAVEDAVANATSGSADGVGAAYPYSPFYSMMDEAGRLIGQLFTCIALALVMVSTVSFLMSGFDLLLTIANSMICAVMLVEAIGLLAAHNLTAYNPIGAVNLVVGVGIAASYAIHLSNAYTHALQRRAAANGGEAVGASAVQRAHPGLVAETFAGPIGTGVVLGISSTLLCILTFAFSNFRIIRDYFFRLFLFILGAGAVNVFVVLPSVLCWLSAARAAVKTAVGRRPRGRGGRRNVDEAATTEMRTFDTDEMYPVPSPLAVGNDDEGNEQELTEI